MEGFRGRIVERGRQRGEWTVGKRGLGLGSGSAEAGEARVSCCAFWRRSFKTLEQLLAERAAEEEEEEVKPIVFTDHTGTEDKTRIVGAGINPITVDRNAVGFEVGVWAA